MLCLTSFSLGMSRFLCHGLRPSGTEPLESRFRQNQLLLMEQVVRIQVVAAGNPQPWNVPPRPNNIRVVRFDCQEAACLGKTKCLEQGRHVLRFRLRYRQLAEQGDLRVYKLAQEGHPGRETHGLFRKSIAEVDWILGMGASAAAANVRAERSHSSPAGPLLPEELLRAPLGLRTVAGHDGADAPIRLVHHDNIMQQLLADT